MFRAKCPCCGAELMVDDRSQRIVASAPPEDETRSSEERVSEKLERIRREKAEQEKKFQEAQEKERTRKERLAALFDDATKKVKEQGPVEKPPERFWD